MLLPVKRGDMIDQERSLEGRRILVVEDEFLVAEYISEILRSAGAEVLGPLGTVDDALDYLAGGAPRIDAAVLDVNLHGRASYAIADALASRGVRIVLTTGYDGASLEAAYRSHPRCEKPFREEALLAALRRRD
jgi:CheY-like chemotaxis protein